MRRTRTIGLVVALIGCVLAGAAAAQTAGAPPAKLWEDAAPDAVIAPEILRLNAALTRLAEGLKGALVQIRVRRATAGNAWANSRA